ncbi:hypothetical protein H1C71_038541, partial [Ictidomys tridecemlineatus]
MFLGHTNLSDASPQQTMVCRRPCRILVLVPYHSFSHSCFLATMASCLLWLDSHFFSGLGALSSLKHCLANFPLGLYTSSLWKHHIFARPSLTSGLSLPTI